MLLFYCISKLSEVYQHNINKIIVSLGEASAILAKALARSEALSILGHALGEQV